jgi:hypothetical protein
LLSPTKSLGCGAVEITHGNILPYSTLSQYCIAGTHEPDLAAGAEQRRYKTDDLPATTRWSRAALLIQILFYRPALFLMPENL